MKGAESDIDNEPPPYSVTQVVNSSLYACKVSFSRTQKRKFVRIEFLLTATQQRFVLLCFFYMTSTCTVQVHKSTKDFQLNEHTVFRSWNERKK